ncbi:hypothetical protein O6H91_02G043100 [Diphasiastrum complanatum]|uniref:Uncharacterized protein n=1 Tax=Diphasiastrum complanatum TaxID=34168 RepID=A0ACC2EF26_DIPCM|nr:hypothetical protein O6H91_02G043100 [Diphasiastrum complanatum]
MNSPKPSPSALHRCHSPHFHHHHHHHLNNTPPSSPSQAAAIQASECFHKDGIVAAHWAALHDAHVLEKGLHPIEGPLPEVPIPSLPPQNVKPILIKDLKLGKVHRGRALNGTLCTDSLKVHSVLNVLEDETGLATKLRICNALPINYSMLQAQRLYPKGSRIAVLEPYLTEFSDGTIGILVEKPSDVVFLWVPEIADEDLHKLQVPPFADEALHELQRSDEAKTVASECSQLPDEAEAAASKSSQLLDESKAAASNSNMPDSRMQTAILSESGDKQEMKLNSAEAEISEKGYNSFENYFDQAGHEIPNSGGSQILKDMKSGPNSAENISNSVAEELPLPFLNPVEPEFERSKDALDGLEVKPSLSVGGVAHVVELPTVEEQPEIEHLAETGASEEADGASKLQDTNAPERILEVGKNEAEELQQKYAPVASENSREFSAADIINTEKRLGTLSNEESYSEPDAQQLRRVKPAEVESQHCGDAFSDENRNNHQVSVSDEVEASLDAKSANHKSDRVEINGGNYSSGKDYLADPLENLDAKSLRIRGNRLFADADWKGAADFYTRAIRKAEGQQRTQDNGVFKDEDEVLLGYSNRSEAWLRQKKFEKAQADAEKALSLSPNHAKGLFRLARAFLGLGKQVEALPVLEAAKKLAPNDNDLQEALKQCRASIQRPKSKIKKKQRGAQC